MKRNISHLCIFSILTFSVFLSGCNKWGSVQKTAGAFKEPTFKLIPADTFYFKSMVDCNMA